MIYYNPFPSTHHFSDYPVNLAYKTFKDGVLSCNDDLTIVGYFVGLVALPISLALAPICSMADIIVGISEAIFLKYRGAEKEDIKVLLFKKLVISPTYQGMGFIANSVSLICFPIWPLISDFSSRVLKPLSTHLDMHLIKSRGFLNIPRFIMERDEILKDRKLAKTT